MAPFDQLADRVSAALWNLHPVWAVRLGKHEYDGQVPDLSAGALAAGHERLGRLREQLVGLEERAPGRDLDRSVLLAALDTEVLAGEGPAGWRRSPCRYLEPLAIGAYLGRDYAPAGLRLERAASVLERAGEVLAAARVNLEEVLSRPAVEWGIERVKRRADRLEGATFPLAGLPDPAGERRLREAATRAAAELHAFAEWLEAERLPRAAESEVFGAGVVERMLWEGGPAGRSAAEAAERARRALTEDGAALTAIEERPVTGEVGPAPAGGPGEALIAAIEEAAAFAHRVGVASLLEEIPLTVMEDSALPAGSARLDPPGPYDDPAAGAVLQVGPTAGEADAGALHDLAMAAAYPGRLLQARHRAAATGEVLRRFAARGCEEGWVLYAGEAMWEAGYRRQCPMWRRAWLRRALRAGCRLACAVELHAGEMTLEQAEGSFMEQARCDEATARREAARVAVDPGCGGAALGRLEILDLRRRWVERFPDGGMGAFHEALLSGGAPPLGLLSQAVLP